MKTDKSNLTKREIEIIKLIADGYSYTKIAQKLFISPETVISHRKSAKKKLGAKNIANLVKIAMERNII